MLVVVGGSTGAGKSTIVNTLVGREISRSSALRPTTRRPVLIHHPEDAHWFEGTRILADLARHRVAADAPASTGSEAADTHALELRAVDSLPRGVAIVDAPDLDSVAEDNRALAKTLLDTADAWVFVTTAARYADAVPWQMLREAAVRDLALAVVLNRVPAGADREIRPHLAQMLDSDGLTAVPIISIDTRDGISVTLPAADVEPIRNWLHALGDTAEARSHTVRRTVAGTLSLIIAEGEEILADTVDMHVRLVDAAAVIPHEIYALGQRVHTHMADGSLLRHEVLARWQEVVGTTQIARALDAGVARVTHSIRHFFTGRTVYVRTMNTALVDGVAAMLVNECATAVERVRAAWSTDRVTRHILDEVAPVPVDLIDERIRRVVRQWETEVVAMVRDTGAARKMTARVLAVGVNLLALALMIVIFASTGGLTGAEIGVAGASSVVAQRLLESVFGDHAVTQMCQRAHEALLARIDEEMTALLTPLVEALPAASGIDELRHALDQANEVASELISQSTGGRR